MKNQKRLKSEWQRHGWSKMSNFQHKFPEDRIEKAWRHEGRPCVIVNVRGNHYCGYTRTHLSDLSYDVIHKYSEHDSINLIDINGGLTYGPDPFNFIGFDCGHSWDVCYNNEGEQMTELVLDEEPTEWYLEDVVNEVEYLADQIECLENFVEAQ